MDAKNRHRKIRLTRTLVKSLGKQEDIRYVELIATPLKQRQRGFVLTPLIDVIFLLLVFFMLSSQIAPYSLLTVSGGGAGSDDTGAHQTQAAAKESEASDVIFIVSRGHIRTGTATIPIDQLPKALEQLQVGNAFNATVFTTRSATVQDVVTALEMFKAAQIANVRLLMNRS